MNKKKFFIYAFSLITVNFISFLIITQNNFSEFCYLKTHHLEYNQKTKEPNCVEGSTEFYQIDKLNYE